MTKPKILHVDIETMANKVYTWGKYEQNALAYDQHWYILSFAWKWLGEKTVHVKGLPDYKGYKSDPTNDFLLVKELWELINEADVVIAHNGRAFDVKKTTARFIVHNLPPPRPFKQVDTKEVAKRYFKFDSNSLNDLADYFKIGRKINVGGFGLWLACEKGDKKAWAKMKKYNKHDVVLLEKVYMRMLPFMNNHPNIALLSGNKRSCPNCGSHNVQRRGTSVTRVSVFQRHQCQDCGAWSQSPNDSSQIR